MPESKLEQQPWLRRLYAGYAFSIDYRELRGHAYMLFDQEVTERRFLQNFRPDYLPKKRLSRAGRGKERHSSSR